jgi:hypothetical protein
MCNRINDGEFGDNIWKNKERSKRIERSPLLHRPQDREEYAIYAAGANTAYIYTRARAESVL